MKNGTNGKNDFFFFSFPTIPFYQIIDCIITCIARLYFSFENLKCNITSSKTAMTMTRMENNR